MRYWALIPAAAILAGGCARQDALSQHMEEHFREANALRAAVIEGNVPATKQSANWLAEHTRQPDLPRGWFPHLQAFRTAATGATDAITLDQAATAAGALGAACGQCHSEFAVGLASRFGIAPEEDASTVDRMRRHEWAADRLWEGLIGSSDEAWAAGIDALAEAPLQPAGMGEEAEAIATLASRVSELAVEGGNATDLTARGETYGRLLSTCGSCHELLRNNP